MASRIADLQFLTHLGLDDVEDLCGQLCRLCLVSGHDGLGKWSVEGDGGFAQMGLAERRVVDVVEGMMDLPDELTE